MPKHRNQYYEEFKMNAVKLSNASLKTIKETSMDLEIQENLLYNWRKKDTAARDKTPVAKV